MKENRKLIRDEGTFYNMENNVVNRTLAEQIDDHQMAIYELMKLIFPEANGYEAVAHEEKDGSVKTKFSILKRKEKNE